MARGGELWLKRLGARCWRIGRSLNGVYLCISVPQLCVPAVTRARVGQALRRDTGPIRPMRGVSALNRVYTAIRAGRDGSEAAPSGRKYIDATDGRLTLGDGNLRSAAPLYG